MWHIKQAAAVKLASVTPCMGVHFWCNIAKKAVTAPAPSYGSAALQPAGSDVFTRTTLCCVLPVSCCNMCADAAMRAIDDIRAKQREDYNRLTVLSDTLAFEADHP